MLKSIYIKSLFGLYTYDLDMKPDENNAIRFITAPNGYGKTTILNMLDGLYSGQMKRLTEIPFDVFRLYFDDGRIVDVEQQRDYRSDENDENKGNDENKEKSDEKTLSDVDLTIKFCKGSIDKMSNSIKRDKSGKFDEFEYLAKELMQLYFASHPIYYIRDKRLDKDETTTTVTANAKDMKERLNKFLNGFNEAFVLGPHSTSGTISMEEYNLIKQKYADDIDILSYWELLKTDPFVQYNDENAGILKIMVDQIAPYLDREHSFIEKLKCLRNIIVRFDFANKKLKISPSYGYRFIANNEDKTILPLDSLSSGEQHTLVMVYELLFKTDDESLVLIDEPELSFHPAWQIDFLNNLRDITKLRKLQCIVCTHSPQMFDNDFRLTLDLYKLSNTVESD